MSGWAQVPWLALLAVPLGLLLFGRPLRLDRRRPVARPPARPAVHVVVPARNEEDVLGLLLDDLRRLDPAPASVTVVDDHSTDATRHVAASFPGVQVLAAPPLPSRWAGKNWASQTGADHATAEADEDELLLFLDADVRLTPDALGQIVDARSERGGVLSVQPFHVVPTPVEQLSGFFNLASMMGIGAGTRRPTGLFGPLLCWRVGDYRRLGGHRRVRCELVEDLALARALREDGIPSAVMCGGEVVRFRMYPHGMGSVLEGWTKNLAAGVGSTPLHRSVGVALWMAGTLSAALHLVQSIGEPPGRIVSALLLYAATALVLGVMLHRVGSYRWWSAVGFPVLGLFFTGIFVRSAWRTYVRRAVRWKGRTLDPRGVVEPPEAEGAAT